MESPSSIQSNNNNFEIPLINDDVEYSKIQNLILDYFQKQNLPEKEFFQKRKIVLESGPFNWPLLPLSSNVLPESKSKSCCNFITLPVVSPPLP